MSEQELVLSVRHVTSGYRDRGLFRFHPGKQDVLRFYLVLEVKNDPLGRLCSDTGCL